MKKIVRVELDGDFSSLAVSLSSYESPSSDGSRERWTNEPQRSKVKAGTPFVLRLLDFI